MFPTTVFSFFVSLRYALYLQSLYKNNTTYNDIFATFSVSSCGLWREFCVLFDYGLTVMRETRFILSSIVKACVVTNLIPCIAFILPNTIIYVRCF